MFTVEFKINGNLVAHLKGVNMGAIVGEELLYRYNYEYYEVEQGIIVGDVVFEREKGIAKLTETILKDVSKIKSKKPKKDCIEANNGRKYPVSAIDKAIEDFKKGIK
jgi:hypothetical protein